MTSLKRLLTRAMSTNSGPWVVASSSSTDKGERSVSDLHGQRRLRRGQTSDGHAERGGADVIQTHLFEEVNRRRITPVLAADAELQIRPSSPPELYARPNDCSHALHVDRGKRILLDDLPVLIDPQKLS